MLKLARIGRLSLSHKLTLLMMTTATVALLLGGAAFLAHDLLAKKTDMLSQQATLAEILALNSVAALDFNDARSGRETLTSLAAHPNVMTAAIYSQDGRIFSLFISPEFPEAEPPESPGAMGGRFTWDHLETFRPVQLRGQQLGTIFIRTSTDEWFASLRGKLMAGLVALGIVGLVSLVLSHLLQRGFLGPILQLADLAREVSRTRNYSLRARKHSADEMGSLVDDFNKMLQEIEHRDSKLSEYGQGLEREVRSRTADLRQLTERLEHQAYHDSLTGLPNRKRYEELCHTTLAEREQDGGQFAVMFLDLERFKLVNDSLGHHFGDSLLKVIAQRLRSCLRSSDIVARQGGDEFTILLTSIDGYDDAERAAERVRASLEPRIELEGQTLHITGSIGVSLYPQDGQGVDELLRHADAAMYVAKASGGNGFHFYSPGTNPAGAELLSLETELRGAIERNEFEAHYQPIVMAATGRVRSFEALVRWRHPDTGLIPPDRFIPLAEETGLITEIDEWVFGEACRQVVAWRLAGRPDLVITVNLSTRQFNRPDLPQRLISIMDREGASTDCIELEITEGTLMNHTDQVQDTLAQLRHLGFRLAVDDFGTGYSSLSYLKRFPLDCLKVDKSFVQDLPHDKDNAAITQAIVAMARSLNLRVTVEGVETEEQLAYLQTLGCDTLQGFLYSKALQADDAEAYLFGQELRVSAR